MWFSCAQLQELSHKLEKVAKQQQVEDEIEALCRHQEQIRALKSRLAKLNAKCNTENKRPDGVAGKISDLADKLDVQVCSEPVTNDVLLNVSIYLHHEHLLWSWTR